MKSGQGIGFRMKENTLIIIGYTGIMKAYLNVSRDEAIKRYNVSEGIKENEPLERALRIEEFSFTDEFSVYSAWKDKGQ